MVKEIIFRRLEPMIPSVSKAYIYGAHIHLKSTQFFTEKNNYLMNSGEKNFDNALS